MEFIIILSTINDFLKAKEISHKLVEEKLAACINIIPQITSIYHWQNEITQDSEFLMLIKTTKTNFDKVKQKITELHPYEVPEIISLKLDDGSAPYLDWIKHSCQ